jgi:hypothetical protein
MKYTSLVLAVLLFGCNLNETVTEETQSIEPVGIALSDSYRETYGITVSEWLLADMPWPDACLEYWDNTRLIIAQWGKFKAQCGGDAGSDPEREAPSYIGCTYLHEDGYPVIVLDIGLKEYGKHKVFIHEVIHNLGSCAGITSDNKHIDDYRWVTIMDRAKLQLQCSARGRFGEEFPDISCVP